MATGSGGAGKSAIGGSRIASMQANGLYAGPQAAQAFAPTQSLPTQQALSAIEAQARQGTPLAGAAQNTLTGVMGSGGISAPTQTGLNNVAGVANGSNGITTGNQYQMLANGSANPHAIQQYLTNYANGSQIGASNDLLNKVLSANAQQITDQANLSASAGGRYGSGAQQGLLTSQLGNLYNTATLGQMNQDQQNQINAAQMLSGEQQNGFSNRMNALNGLTGVQGQNISNQMNSSGMQIGAGQQANAQSLAAAGMAPDIYGLQSAPYQNLLAAGQQQDAYQQGVKQAPYNALNSYANLLSTLNQGAAKTGQANAAQTGLGVAATGAGILGSLF